MAANPHRATVVIDLGGKEYDLCLTNAALAEIEAELQLDAPDLFGRSLGVFKATVIIHAGLRGGGTKVDRAAVVKLLDPMKPGDVIAAALKALHAAFIDPEPEANPPEAASPSAASPGSA